MLDRSEANKSSNLVVLAPMMCLFGRTFVLGDAVLGRRCVRHPVERSHVRIAR